MHPSDGHQYPAAYRWLRFGVQRRKSMNENQPTNFQHTPSASEPSLGAFKAEFGWEPEIFSSQSTQAQVLFRKLPLGFSIAYLPKGPVGKNWASPLGSNRCCLQSSTTLSFLQVESPTLVKAI